MSRSCTSGLQGETLTDSRCLRASRRRRRSRARGRRRLQFFAEAYDAHALIDEQLWRMKEHLCQAGRWDQAAALGSRLREFLSNGRLERGICHMDLTLDNVHVNGDDLTVFDFDSACRCWRAIEPHGVVKHSTSSFRAWLSGYRSVRRFTRTEEQAVWVFAIIGELRTTSWRLGVADSSRGATPCCRRQTFRASSMSGSAGNRRTCDELGRLTGAAKHVSRYPARCEHGRMKASHVIDPDAVITQMIAVLSTALPARLVSVVAFGSCVHGDFEPARSDVDLLAVLSDDPTPRDVTAIGTRLDAVFARHPEWIDRIEAGLVCHEAVRDVLETGRSRRLIGRISPGEPLHLVPTERRRLLDWGGRRARSNGLRQAHGHAFGALVRHARGSAGRTQIPGCCGSMTWTALNRSRTAFSP